MVDTVRTLEVGGLQGFAAYLEGRGMRPATVKAYVRDARSYIVWSLRTPHRDAVQHLRDWVYGARIAPSTACRRLAAVKALCQYRDVIDLTAGVHRPRRRRGKPRPIPDVETKLRAMDPTLRAVATFLLETGLRISEACSVRYLATLPDAELLITGKGGKQRWIPLTNKAVTALHAMGGAIPWSARTVQRKLAAHGLTPHLFRHTFACQLIEAGADLGDVQELLGHSSPDTTRGYAAYGKDRLRAAAERRSV